MREEIHICKTLMKYFPMSVETVIDMCVYVSRVILVELIMDWALLIFTTSIYVKDTYIWDNLLS
jgi:hypothetical protein